MLEDLFSQILPKPYQVIYFYSPTQSYFIVLITRPLGSGRQKAIGSVFLFFFEGRVGGKPWICFFVFCFSLSGIIKAVLGSWTCKGKEKGQQKKVHIFDYQFLFFSLHKSKIQTHPKCLTVTFLQFNRPGYTTWSCITNNEGATWASNESL